MMVARSFRQSGIVTFNQTVLADILVVGGGAAGLPTGKGGDAGTLILQLNYTLPAGTYTVTVGQGGGSSGAAGGDSAFGNLFVARGGINGVMATNNVVNGIAGIGPTISSSYLVVESFLSSGVQQLEVPDRDAPFVLCSEMGIACGSNVQMAATGRNSGDAAGVLNTGSGGDGGSYGGPGASGIVVIRLLGPAASNITIGVCVATCNDMVINQVYMTSPTQPVSFPADIMVDLLLVGGGAGGTSANTGGGSGAVIFYKNFLIPAGSYTLTVGAGGGANQNGGDTSMGSLFVARGGFSSTGAAGGSASPFNVVASQSGINSSTVLYSYSTYGRNALGTGISNVSLLAGEFFSLCSHFATLAGKCTFAEGGRSNLAAVNPNPGEKPFVPDLCHIEFTIMSVCVCARRLWWMVHNNSRQQRIGCHTKLAGIWGCGAGWVLRVHVHGEKLAGCQILCAWNIFGQWCVHSMYQEHIQRSQRAGWQAVHAVPERVRDVWRCHRCCQPSGMQELVHSSTEGNWVGHCGYLSQSGSGGCGWRCWDAGQGLNSFILSVIYNKSVKLYRQDK